MNKYIFLVAFSTMSMLGIANAKDPIAEDKFRKAIDAAGGESRFDTIKAPTMWMEIGTYYGMGEGIPFVAQYATYWTKRWRRQLIEGKFSIGIAGEQVTLFEAADAKGRRLSGPTQETALHQARIGWAQLLYPLLEDEYTLSNITGVDVEDKSSVGVKAVHVSGGEVMLYFDKHTYLLEKIEATVAAQEMDGKQVKSETFFRDHKSFGGVKLPGKYKTFYDGKLIVESEITAIKTHATIDPAWFGTAGPARVR